ncbi:hypothetical protein P7K49_008248 [Saguinus oedipus]|uniref:Uncharacterized protein n=1 Tax=Saguinus oedipus TaxID=9490 RepID=A0ABQ9VX98_SAGOE|nr:hypothetical protein P7K49_008248 [Saguinus oedipus]
MKLRRWIPQGPHTATQGLILSETNKRNRRAPEGPVPRPGSVLEAAAIQQRLQESERGTWRRDPSGRCSVIRRALIGWGSCMPLDDWLVPAQKVSRGSTSAMAFSLEARRNLTSPALGPLAPARERGREKDPAGDSRPTAVMGVTLSRPAISQLETSFQAAGDSVERLNPSGEGDLPDALDGYHPVTAQQKASAQASCKEELPPIALV